MKEKLINLLYLLLEQDIYTVGAILLAIASTIFIIAILYMLITFKKSLKSVKIFKSILLLIMIPELAYMIYWIYIFIQIENGDLIDLPL